MLKFLTLENRRNDKGNYFKMELNTFPDFKAGSKLNATMRTNKQNEYKKSCLLNNTCRNKLHRGMFNLASLMVRKV